MASTDITTDPTPQRRGPLTFGPACCAEPFDHRPSDHMTYDEAAEIVRSIQAKRGW
jgi:hypothetical protein